MKKEKILLQAIGMLPDEMAAQDLTEEILEGAASIEKEEKRHKFIYKCSYAIAAAACFTAIITGLTIWGRDSTQKPGVTSGNNVNIVTDESKNGTINSSGEYGDVKILVYESTESMDKQKSSAKSESSNGIGIKEIPYGRMVKLEVAKGTKYIVFGMDRDFYFTVPQNTGMTYILNARSGKKRSVNGKEVLCKTGNKVYFDISGKETGKTRPGNADTWDKEGTEAVAYTDIYFKNSGKLEAAGRFYIGKKEENKAVKDKEGDVYYGFFESKNGN